MYIEEQKIIINTQFLILILFIYNTLFLDFRLFV